MRAITNRIPAREIAKWCAYAAVLLAPGSFVILPLLWLARQWALRNARPVPVAALSWLGGRRIG